MSDLTPEKLAELRRLLDAATPGPWRDEMMQGKGETLTAIIAGRPNPDDLRVIGSTLAHNDARVLIAAVNTLPALLDAAAERDALAESVRAYGRTIDRWGLLIIAATHSEDITTPDGDGDWEVIESRLAEVPALLAERDALAAKLAEVREWIDRRGVNVDDRDDDYMRGYRDAQRHALHDANELRALLDATPETGGES